MTVPQLLLITGSYLALLIAVTYFTRATRRRIAGALAGGGVGGLLGIGVIILGEAVRWWRVPFSQAPHLLLLGGVGLAVSLAPFLLVTWRLVRRFGKLGLVVACGAVAVIGPVRDYRFAAAFPEWIVFAPGFAPRLAVAATYVGWIALGYAVMRLASGPADEDRLAPRPRKAT